ncbi:MAG: 16S rRNA (guanine(966)-N(2))-methyltransferase RsmD [Bacteroidales bacterium]|nr:16S rRNA (guanine(966)-N(2))-methyltransferase RsmD [Bacteroidales bacterium]
MRIISGSFKGRRFQLPNNLKARPTTDFAKESLFNILQNITEIEDCTALDLFAGTGSIGLEFISRGAKQVTCVEQYTPHISFIRSVAEKLKVDNLLLVKGDVYQYINKCGRQFDIVFADAPYADPRLSEIPSLVFQAGLLKSGAWLVVEHSHHNDFSQDPNFKELRKYGSVHFSFFQAE